MNICHIITRLIVGGAQENTLLTCAGLHQRGHRVTLITGPQAGPEGSLLEQARSGGYQVKVLPDLLRAVRPLGDFQARRALTATIAEIRPDIVHTHSSKAGILGRLAACDAGRAIIIHTIHGMSFNRTQNKLSRWLFKRAEKYCAGFTDRFVSVAQAMTDQAVAAGIAPPDKFVTIYSGMQTEWYDPNRYDRRAVRQSWGVADHEIVIGTMARLFANKGYEQLIPAMARAVQRSNRLRFVWVGDGSRRNDYLGRLKALGIRSQVHLTGLIDPQRVPQVLAGIDVLVHASQWEGLPRAAVQALLMEVPVISFDIDGAPEVVVPGQTGILVPLNDIEQLTEAMVMLAEDADRRKFFGKAGRVFCLKRFDHNEMVDALERLYQDLLTA